MSATVEIVLSESQLQKLIQKYPALGNSIIDEHYRRIAVNAKSIKPGRTVNKRDDVKIWDELMKMVRDFAK